MDSHIRENSMDSDSDSSNKNFLKNKLKTKFEDFVKHWDKYVYTLIILLMYVCWGLVSNIFPAAMMDMKYLFHTSMTLINYSNTFNSLGFLIGSLAGFIYVYINRQLIFIVMCGGVGVFCVLMPLCTELWQLYICQVMVGAGTGAFEIGNSMWVIEMWKGNSAPVLHLTKAFYGVGSIAAPLIAKNYLFGEMKVNNYTDIIYHGNMSSIMTRDELNESIDRRPYIKYPFMYAGGLTLIVPLILVIMFVLKRYRELGINVEQKLSPEFEQMSEKQIIGDSKKLLVEWPPRIKWTIIALMSFSLSFIIGFELLHFQYSATYLQLIPIKLSVQKAANIMSLMATTYTVAKLMFALIAIKVKPEIMLICNFLILFVANAFIFFGNSSELMLWIGNGLMGAGFSAIWPAYISLAEEYIGITNVISSILAFSSNILPLVTPFIIGPYIEKYPVVFIITENSYFALTIVLFVIIMFMLKRPGCSHDNYVINKK